LIVASGPPSTRPDRHFAVRQDLCLYLALVSKERWTLALRMRIIGATPTPQVPTVWTAFQLNLYGCRIGDMKEPREGGKVATMSGLVGQRGVVENAIEIDARPEAVFDYCTDVLREPEWKR
jgi:hypothetical protein